MVSQLYRTIWRWHFYAGLFVLPFVLVLSVTGAIYLFKPQIERWEERDFRNLGTQGATSPDAQLTAALAAFPGARFNQYRLPRQAGDAAMIRLALQDGSQRDVFVSPQGAVLGSLNPQTRIASTVAVIHGSLLLGKWGDWLVELAASWTIVMILTGLYLWWPRPFRFAGALWPRFPLRGRPLLKDLHRVTGFWVSGLVLVMLVSGLPWAGAWGSAFKWMRTELGLIQGSQNWKIGAQGGHAGHADHQTAPQTARESDPPLQPIALAEFVAKAEAEHMAFPVLVLPPHAPQAFGPPTGDVWTVKSETQNRPLARQVTYDPATGAETGRNGFADNHLIDRVVGYGVAWHEGQLLGPFNQILGLMTAAALIAISIVGVMMWLKRRPVGELGAPPRASGARLRWLIAGRVVLGSLLPLFGASVITLLFLDRLFDKHRAGPMSAVPGDRGELASRTRGPE